jgi:hypothetical protein
MVRVFCGTAVADESAAEESWLFAAGLLQDARTRLNKKAMSMASRIVFMEGFIQMSPVFSDVHNYSTWEFIW